MTDIFPYGMYKGRRFKDVPALYLVYMLENDMLFEPWASYVIENLEWYKNEAIKELQKDKL